MARQTSHVIVQHDDNGPKKPVRPRDPVASGERDAAHNRMAGHNYFLLEKFEAGVALRGTEVKSIARVTPTSGIPTASSRRRGVFAQLAYRSLLPRKPGQPRRDSHPETAAAQRRGSQATFEDADQGSHAHPHPPLFP